MKKTFTRNITYKKITNQNGINTKVSINERVRREIQIETGDRETDNKEISRVLCTDR